MLYERTHYYNSDEGVFYSRIIQYDINSLKEISSDVICLGNLHIVSYKYEARICNGCIIYFLGDGAPEIYSINIKTSEIKDLGQHRSTNFVSNGKELFFQTETNNGKSNIYQIDLNTGEEILEVENVDKDLSIVTDNYIYLYRADIACESNVPTLEFTIFRGYSVEQIPRNK